MTMFASKRPLRAALGAGLLSAALLGSPLGSSHAHAMSACRSDPIVVLSNGAVLDLSAIIDDDITDISQVRYVLHAPAGTWVVSAIPTDGLMGYKEVFEFHADSPSSGSQGVYTSDAQVTTGTQGVAVTATIAGAHASLRGTLPALLALKLSSLTLLATASGQGQSNQDVAATIAF